MYICVYIICIYTFHIYIYKKYKYTYILNRTRNAKRGRGPR